MDNTKVKNIINKLLNLFKFKKNKIKIDSAEKSPSNKSGAYLVLKDNWRMIWDSPWTKSNPVYIQRKEIDYKIESFLETDQGGSLLIGGNRGTGKTSSLYYVIGKLLKKRIIDRKKVFIIRSCSLNLANNDNLNAIVVDFSGLMLASICNVWVSKFKMAFFGWLSWFVEFLESFGISFLTLDILDFYKNISKEKRKEEAESFKVAYSGFELWFGREIKNLFTFLFIYFPVILFFFSRNKGIPLFDIKYQMLKEWFLSLSIFAQFWLVVPILIVIFFGGLSRRESVYYDDGSLKVDKIQNIFLKLIEKISKKRGIIKKALLWLKRREHQITRAIFVFDELDYYDDGVSDNGGEKQLLLKTLKNFKLLFNSSAAKFIFIVGPNVYREMTANDGIFETIATNKISINDYSYEELFQFLNNITNTKDNDFRDIKLYLIGKSGINFYRLIQLIESRTLSGRLSVNVSFDEKVISKMYEGIFEIIKLGTSDHNEADSTFRELSIIIDKYEKWVNNREWQEGIKVPNSSSVVLKNFKIFIRSLYPEGQQPDIKLGGEVNPVSWDSIVEFIVKENSFISRIKGNFEEYYKDEVDILNGKIDLIYGRILPNKESQKISWDEKFKEILDRLRISSGVLEQLEELKKIDSNRYSLQKMDILRKISDIADDVSNRFVYINNSAEVAVSRIVGNNVEVKDDKSLFFPKRNHETARSFASMITWHKNISSDFKKILIEGSFRIKNNGILDFVLGKGDISDTSLMDDTMYLFRFDTRGGKDPNERYYYTDSILIWNKQEDPGRWNYVEGANSNNITPKDKWIKFRFKVEQKNNQCIISLERGDSENNDNFKKRINHTILNCSDNFKWFGVANELEDCEIIVSSLLVE